MNQLRPSIAARFGAFVLERYPFAASAAASALEILADTCGELSTGQNIERSRVGLPAALRRALASPPANLPETTPAMAAPARWTAAVDELIDACDGFLRRAAIETTLTADERREMLRGMALTRATDNRLKAFFSGAGKNVQVVENVDIGAGFAAQAIKDLGHAGKAFSVGWNVIPNEIAALKNGTQIALFDQNWPQQAAFGAIACATFMKTGKVLPNTQHLTVVTKANLASAQAKLADIKTYALNGLP